MLGDRRVRIASALGHCWAYLWGRVDLERSFRYSVVLGLAATTLVTGFTYVAVGLGPGVEANPLLGWVIDSYGWGAFAAVRYAVVIGAFAIARPFAALEEPWPEWTEGNGRMIAAICWVNAVRDGFVVATGVVPTFVLLRWLGLV